MKRPARRILVALLLAALLGPLLLSACEPEPPLPVGFIGGLTGRVADLGVAGRDGALLALEQRNAAGGIRGRQLTLRARDDRQDPAVAVTAVETLAAEGVELLVGPMTSAMALAVLPAAERHGLLVLSPTVTTDQLSGRDDGFFRVISPASEYATASARYHAAGGLRRVSLIRDASNAAYVDSWAEAFAAELTRLGGTVAGDLRYDGQSRPDYPALAEQALAGDPQAVVIIAGAVDTAQLAQQLRKRPEQVQIVASEWAATERFVELGGRAVEGVYMAQFLDRNGRQPGYLAFRQAFEERYGRTPGFAELAGYDAMNVALDALAARRGDEPLKQTLLRLRRFDGAQQTIVFDDFGDAHRRTYITVVDDGSFVVRE